MMMDSSKIYLNQLEELNNLSQIGKQMNIDLPLMDLNSKDLILNEGKLMELNKEVRKKWRTKVGKLIASEYKSTLWGTNVKDLQGFEYHFSYETLLNDENDFADLLGYEIQGMKSKTFLFSSGMAAISHMLYCFSSFLKNNLVIQSSIGYFETKYFLKVLASMGNTVKLDFRTDINANLFYFEPIKYDATLSLTDIDVVLRRINESDAKIKFVIMDSTMHNRTKIFDHLIDKIQNIKNVILCDIRSGLKLDQEGLELSNLGVSTIFVSKSNVQLFEAIRRYIEQYKSLTGANLSFYSLVLNHYFSHNCNSVMYTKKIDQQVMWAESLLRQNSSSNIKRVVYRKASYCGEILIAPFLFLELNTKRESDYLSTIKLFQKKMSSIGLPIDYRNSWGFRFPSIEYFNDIFSHQKYIKYYPGAFKGLTASNAIRIFNEL